MPTQFDIPVPSGIASLASMFCGCGDRGAAWAAVLAELERCGSTEKPKSHETGEWYILAYLLDYCNLTEHGGSVNYAWLTPDGDECLSFLRRWGAEWQQTPRVQFVSTDADGIEVSVSDPS